MDKIKENRIVCKETLDFLRGQIDWNKHDMGEMGEFIRTKYVYNLIDDMEKAMTSNWVRMNWPFAEESTQDGANIEMDAEDAPDEGDEGLEYPEYDPNSDDSCVEKRRVGNLRWRVGQLEAYIHQLESGMDEDSVRDARKKSVRETDSLVDPHDVAEERWEVVNKGKERFIQNIYDDLDVTIASVADSCIGRSDQVDAMVAAPQLLEALEIVERSSILSRIQRGTVSSDTIKCEMNPDEWRILTDAIKKARGE